MGQKGPGLGWGAVELAQKQSRSRAQLLLVGLGLSSAWRSSTATLQ